MSFITCMYCDKEFEHQLDCMTHIANCAVQNKHQPNNSGLFECQHCSFASTSKNKLGEHLVECQFTPAKAYSFEKTKEKPLINDKTRQDLIYFLGQLDSLRFLFMGKHYSSAQIDFIENLSVQYHAILYDLLGTHFE